MVLWPILGSLATISSMIIAASAAAFVYRTTFHRSNEPSEVRRAKLGAYEEVMAAVVALNRTAVDIGEERFHQEADKLLMDKESVLEEPHAEMSATYQRYYYLMDKDVYEAADEYVDYLVEYHDEGAMVGELLTRGGEVGAAMRSDLDLPPLGNRSAPEERERP